MNRSKLMLGLVAGVLAAGSPTAWSQDNGSRPIPTGARGTPNHGERGAPQTGSRTQNNSQTNSQTPSTRSPGRAPAGGVRAPAGGTRAPAGGVRAPAGGVRAPGSPGSGGAVDSPPGQGGPGQPGNPGNPGGWPGGGSGGGCDHKHTCRCVLVPWFGFWGRGWNTLPTGWRNGTVSGPSNREFEGTEPEPVVELTAYETARMWLNAGNAEAAVSWFEAHLKEYPTQIGVMREYAVALLQAGRMADAVAMMGYVYDLSPGLANEPLDPGLWGGSATRMRASVTATVRHAQRASSGNAWLTVAVIMQAEGRDAVALRMAERARDEGLSPVIFERLRLRLTRR